MKFDLLEITGMPYFPGVTTGRLRHGVSVADSGHIALITQREVSHLKTRPAGIIVVEAAPFSHAMIGLLGLGVPTVLISSGQAARLDEGAELRIDGNTGRITGYSGLEILESKRPRVPLAGQCVSMADGEPVRLHASVRTSSAASKAVAMGARAIGLVRTEFLVPESGAMPGQEFYRETFRALCEAASPLALTFRLLDIAPDKSPGWLTGSESTASSLGLQGVRLYGDEHVRQVIDAQLIALSELSHQFDISLLIPFLVRLEEYEHWQVLVRNNISESVPVGAMAETLAAVSDIAAFLAQADFVAIGCNDLMQGLFAADRDLGALRHYLDPYAPLLFRLFKQVAELAGSEQGRIKLCGVLPQIQGVLPVLLGLGYRSFSVDAPFIPYLAEIVENNTQSSCSTLASDVCTALSTREVLEVLQLPMDRHPPFLF